MENNLLIEILIMGEQVGIGKEYNVSNVFTKFFEIPVFVDRSREEWISEVEPQKEILISAVTEYGYLSANTNEFDKINWVPLAGPITWFNDTEIKVRITHIGLNYLYQYRLNESVIELNRATLKSYKSQNHNARAITFFAAISAILSFFTLISTVFKGESKKRIQPKQEQLDTPSPSKKNSPNPSITHRV